MADIGIDFEKTCTECGGYGGCYDGPYERTKCEACNGEGVTPTELGKAVLRLIAHNKEKLLKGDESCFD